MLHISLASTLAKGSSDPESLAATISRSVVTTFSCSPCGRRSIISVHGRACVPAGREKRNRDEGGARRGQNKSDKTVASVKLLNDFHVLMTNERKPETMRVHVCRLTNTNNKGRHGRRKAMLV